MKNKHKQKKKLKHKQKVKAQTNTNKTQTKEEQNKRRNTNKTNTNKRSCVKNTKTKQKKIQATSKETFDMILNKSDIELDQYDKEVLSKGLNFALTPAWGRSVENNEWHNAYQHIRREEWRALLGDESEMSNPLPEKLKIRKNSTPNREQLDEKTNAYVDMVLFKLCNLKEVQRNYRKKNNLPKEQRNS